MSDFDCFEQHSRREQSVAEGLHSADVEHLDPRDRALDAAVERAEGRRGVRGASGRGNGRVT